LAAVQAWPTLRIFRLDGAIHDTVDVVLAAIRQRPGQVD
jgi:hypothetical protein